MSFSKGHKTNVGRILSEDWKRKIGLANSIALKGQISPNKGKTFSKEWKYNLSKAHRGKTPGNKGKKASVELRKKLSDAHRGLQIGSKNPAWKGGITPINAKIRASLEYRLWRKAVLERDKYICIWCGQRQGSLHVDHIKRFSDYPELRFAIDNGRTLCFDCHKTTDTYGNKARNFKI